MTTTYKVAKPEDYKEDIDYAYKLSKAHAKCYADVFYLLHRIEGINNCILDKTLNDVMSLDVVSKWLIDILKEYES
jgi:hypothetical protein